jgi:hypothetical protein
MFGAFFFALAAVTLTIGAIAVLGETVWQDDGVVVCGFTNDQSDPQIVYDGSGGAIVAPRTLPETAMIPA